MSARARSAAALGALSLVTSLVTAAAMAAAGPSYAGDNDPTTCLGRTVTISGTAGPEVRIGSFGSDVIATYAGNDVVRGDANFGSSPQGAADYICLGKGDDVADGSTGPDIVSGGNGNDVIDGGNGQDGTVNDDDLLLGGPGNDSFTGGAGDDTIRGGPGNDVIDPPGAGLGVPTNAGADVIRAGSGDDLVTEHLDGSIDYIDGESGNDRCVVDVADVVENCETVIRVPAGG